MAAPVPLVGDLTLSAAQVIEHTLCAGFEPVPIPGLDGDVQQRAGRRSHVIGIRGVLTGETALNDLAALQKLAASGAEVPFSADISTALELEQVVVTDLRVRAVAGTRNLISYEIRIVESPPLPPPAQVSGFGGLDDFGMGDLGFDTDVMAELSAAAEGVASAVDTVMDAADQLTALVAAGSIDIGGPLKPLGDAVDAAGSAANTYSEVSNMLSELIGRDT